jgi:chemotaxis protein methyltransferase CheR
MRWLGFRKVHSQTSKRIHRRIKQLDVDGIAGYRSYLEKHSDEWQTLDALCRVTISRFYRDKQMFAFLEHEVLPDLAQRVIARGDDCLRVWSVGAGSGEEPYTIAIIWRLMLQQRFPDLRLQIIATDIDPNMIQRAQAACYDYASVKNLPERWRDKVFNMHDGRYCLKQEYQGDVQFVVHDVREDFMEILDGNLFREKLDLVLCRNLVFTYFDEPLQNLTFERILPVLTKAGALVLGIHEQLPDNVVGVKVWSQRLRIFEKININQCSKRKGTGHSFQER